MTRRGYSSLEIRKVVYPGNRHNRYHTIVNKIIANADMYDTYIDEVAVERAWMGDRAVWEAMTNYERQALVSKIEEAYYAGKPHPHYPGSRPVGWGSNKNVGWGFGVEKEHSEGWLSLLATELGEHPKRFLRVIDRRRVRARALEHQSA
jgi:hypothetical protein